MPDDTDLTTQAGPLALVRFHRAGPLALALAAWGNEYEIILALAGAEERPDFDRVGDMAVVTIKDPLVHHPHIRWDCYDAIVRRAQSAFESDATKVVLRINSPGGDVDGCFDAARALRALAVKHAKPLIAYVDGLAASAAYALACAAPSIVVSSTSTVGSIGIIEGLRDQVAADEARGERYVLVTSGARKADGNPHVAISDEAVKNLQGQVDGLAELFFELVEELRGLPAEKARAMQAKVFFGANAVREGLADSVMTWSGLTNGQELTSGASESGENMPAQASHLRYMLRSIAESSDDDVSKEEKEQAKRCLKMLEEGGEKKAEEPKKEEAEGKKAAKGEEPPAEKEEKSAKAEEPKKEEAEGKKAAKGEDEGPEGKKAAAAMAERLQAIETERAEEKAATKRAALMATRPDLTAEVRAWLDSEPVDVVERALKTLPKGPARAVAQAAAASQAGGTRGASQTDDGAYGGAAPELESFIGKKMGISGEGTGIRRTGRALELGFMTPAQAKAHLHKKGTNAAESAEKGE